MTDSPREALRFDPSTKDTGARPPLRLCLAGPYPRDPRSIGGGVEYIVYVLAETWAERADLDLHVVAPVKGLAGIDVVRRGNATIHFVGMPARRFVPNLLTQSGPIARVMAELRPDVVNSHHIVTTAAAIKAHRRVVHVIHGIEKRELPHKVGRALVAGWVQAVMDQMWIGRSDAVVSVCRYGLDQFPDLARNGVVAWAPVEDLFFEVPPMKPSRQLLYVGVIGRRKNLMALLRALPRVLAEEPEVVLRVCGGIGETDYGEQARRFIAAHGLQGAVRFEGVVDRKTLAGYLGESVGLVLPSLQETAPVVVSQTMAAGRVALAAPAGGVSELLDHDATGLLIDPNDPEGLAEQILSLLHDFPRAQSLGLAARAVARERHQRHVAGERFLTACRKVALPNHVPVPAASG